MSQENVEIVRRVFEAAAKRDAAALFDLYDPEVVWDNTQSPYVNLGAASVYEGHAGLREVFRQYREPWSELVDVCDELIDAGERVFSQVRTRARGRRSGIELEQAGFYGVWTVEAGKVTQVAWFSDRAKALDAAGLPE